jgi:site-specific recombinase XerD
MAQVRRYRVLDPSVSAALASDWLIHLKVGNLSRSTQLGYRQSVEAFQAFLSPRALVEASQRDVKAFVAHLLDTRRAETAKARLNGLKQFYRWCVAEGELVASPAEGVGYPKLPQASTAVLSPAEVQLLLEAAVTRPLYARRDTAMVRLLFDTGARRAEVANLQVSDLFLAQGYVCVVGKGNKPRLVPIGDKTRLTLGRYLRRHPGKGPLWLGRGGKPMTPAGIQQVIEFLGRTAGVRVHTHMFRHTFAHEWLSSGGNEGDLMTIAGWSSRSMLDRYGRSAATQRAMEAHRRLSPGDKL